MSRYRSGTITIDVDEIIDAIEDDDLLEEVRRRKLPNETAVTLKDAEDIELAYEALCRNRPAEAMSILDRILHPKWRTKTDCVEQYAKARA